MVCYLREQHMKLLLLMGPLPWLYRAGSSHSNPPKTNLSHVSGHWCSLLTMSHLAGQVTNILVTLFLGDLLIQGLKCLHQDASFPGVALCSLLRFYLPCPLVRGRWLGFVLCSPKFCTACVPAKQSFIPSSW